MIRLMLRKKNLLKEILVMKAKRKMSQQNLKKKRKRLRNLRLSISKKLISIFVCLTAISST